MNEPQKSVLLVCMGNICRSPTAEGVLRKLALDAGLGSRLKIDSAGTHAYHIGEAPDPRSVIAAQARGIDLSEQSARAVDISDFHEFDLILAMDDDNLAFLERMQPEGSRATVRLFLSYSEANPDKPVPDPYYGGENGFERVLDLLEEAGRCMLKELA
jgi:protein-tyrosine phosphatase